MPVPTLSKSWYFDVNLPIAAQASILETSRKLVFNIKNILLSRGLWTVVRSSDSVSTSNSDLWLSESNLNWSGTSGGRSWIVLRNSNISNCEILIDLYNPYVSSFDTSNYMRYYIQFKISPSGFNLDGSITSSPTSNYPTISQQINYLLPGNVSSYLNIMQSQDGECTRIIARFPSTSTPGQAYPPSQHPYNSIIMIEKITSHLSNDRLYSPIALIYDSAGTAFYKIILKNPLTLTSAETSSTLSYANSYNSASLSDSTSFKYSPYSQIISKYGLSYNLYPNRGSIGLFQDFWYKLKITDSINGGFHVCSVPADNSKSFMQFYNYLFPWNGTTCLSP